MDENQGSGIFSPLLLNFTLLLILHLALAVCLSPVVRGDTERLSPFVPSQVKSQASLNCSSCFVPALVLQGPVKDSDLPQAEGNSSVVLPLLGGR